VIVINEDARKRIRAVLLAEAVAARQAEAPRLEIALAAAARSRPGPRAL
jgi:hypothetical protein